MPAPRLSAQWAYDYDPFGVARTTTQVATSAPANPLRYAGELLDVTGNYHLRARQYDPALGRMLSIDPLAPEPDDPYVASYVYANNRPTLLTDPSGMDPFTTVIGGVWDATKDVYHGIDTQNGEGWSGRIAIFNQFNPVYQVMDRGSRGYDAASCGHWREAVRQTTHVGLTVAPYVHAATRGTSVIGRFRAPRIGAAAEEVAGAARAYNPANLGRSYGSRTVVEDPGIRITGFRGSANPADPFHGLNRVIERGFSPADIMSTMRSPAAVLEQPGGRFMYLGERGAVVVGSDGQVVRRGHPTSSTRPPDRS